MSCAEHLLFILETRPSDQKFISAGSHTSTSGMPSCLQVQILLQKKGLSLNPVTTMYYIAPVSFAFLSLPWGFIEARKLFTDESVSIFCTVVA